MPRYIKILDAGVGDLIEEGILGGKTVQDGERRYSGSQWDKEPCDSMGSAGFYCTAI